MIPDGMAYADEMDLGKQFSGFLWQCPLITKHW